MAEKKIINDKNVWLKLIADLRRKHLLSQRVMAEKLGISVATLRKIEKGIFPERIGVEIVFRVTDEFGVSLHDQFAPGFSISDTLN